MKHKIARSVVASAMVFGISGFQAPLAFSEEIQSLQKIEVTGSSIKSIEGETGLPVTIIKGEMLREAGVTTVEEAVRLIPANQSERGINQSFGAISGGRAEANLRALGANKTLVLLNGRRVTNHAFTSGSVDLYAIPIAAIERIEILRDGASAIYGTDAIGGVINFITRNNYRGAEFSAQQQSPQKSGGSERQFTLSAGSGSLNDDRFNLFGVLDYRKQQALTSRDREFAASGVHPERGVVLSSGATLPANIFQPSTGVVGNPSFPACSSPLLFSNPGVFGPTCRYDFTGLVDLIPENEQRTFLGRAMMKLAPDHNVSFEYLRAENKVIGRAAPSPFFGFTMTPANPYFPGNGITPAVAGVDPTQDISFNWRASPAGLRTAEDLSIGQRLVAAFDGNFADWNYRAGLLWAGNHVESFLLKGFPDFQQLADAFLNGNPTYLNPFGDPTPAEQEFIDSTDISKKFITAKGEVNGADLLATKEFGGFFPRPMALALGAEARREHFHVNSDDPGSIQSQDGSRRVSALLTELLIPLTSSIEAQLALRHDRYSDVGDTTNPKLALRFQPNKAFMMRASYNTGFRAPTLYEIHQPEGIGGTVNAYNDPLLCPNGVPVAGANPTLTCHQQFGLRHAGSTALQPEKSRTYTLGIVLQPTPAFTASLDYWNIILKDQIGVVSEQAIFADPVKYASKFVRCGQLSATVASSLFTCNNGAGGIAPLNLAYIDSPNENLGEIRTKGFDLGLAYRWLFGSLGRLTLSYDATYVQSYRFQREKDGAFIDSAGRVVDSLPVFRWQHTLSTNWRSGDWSTLLINRFKSGYRDQNDPATIAGPEFENNVKPYSLWDFSVAWTGIKNLSVAAGVKNIFDTKPPFSNQGSTFQANYDPRVTDALGRTFLLRATYKFK